LNILRFPGLSRPGKVPEPGKPGRRAWPAERRKGGAGGLLPALGALVSDLRKAEPKKAAPERPRRPGAAGLSLAGGGGGRRKLPDSQAWISGAGPFLAEGRTSTKILWFV
jgi:hypothetical protein